MAFYTCELIVTCEVLIYLEAEFNGSIQFKRSTFVFAVKADARQTLVPTHACSYRYVFHIIFKFVLVFGVSGVRKGAKKNANLQKRLKN